MRGRPGGNLIKMLSVRGIVEKAPMASITLECMLRHTDSASAVAACLPTDLKEPSSTLAIVHVDDYRIMGDAMTDVDNFIALFNDQFPLKETSAERYLGMDIIHDRARGELKVSMLSFIDKFLDEYNIGELSPCRHSCSTRDPAFKTPEGAHDSEALPDSTFMSSCPDNTKAWPCEQAMLVSLAGIKSSSHSSRPSENKN